MAQNVSKDQQVTYVNSLAGAVFNAFVPGAGYIFRGQTVTGGLTLAVITAAIIVPTIPLPVAFVVWIIMIGDCIDEALQQQHEEMAPLLQDESSSDKSPSQKSA